MNTNPYFTADKNFAATDFTGAKGGNEFAGILLRSADYQPHFYFTQKAVDEIRAASETTGKNFLRIRVYAIQKNNGFMVGNTWVPLEQWTTVDVPISMVSTELQLWSQSEGTTEVYLWFDMYRLDIPEKLGPIDASFFEGVDCNIGAADFQGEVDGITLNGVQFKTVDYQPYFKFTAAGLEKIKAYAAENGYNFLNIHSYALLYNNGFIVGQTHTEPSAWNTTQVKIDELDESFRFWSQSEGATEIYLWFTWEKLDIPEATSPITAAFFEGIGCNITTRDFMGTVGEATINGVQIKSGDYQPYFRFTQAGLETIRSYAAQNGFDLLRIHSYAIQYNNGFIIGEKWTGLEQWNVTDVELSNLTVDFRFWSQSEGATEVYLWFEFGKAPAKPLLPASYFTGAFTFENFEGEVGGEQILAVKATSANYQPHFSFTEDAIAAIKAYAEENGFDTLRIHAYANLTNNSFVLGGSTYIGAEWKTTDVDITTLTESYSFWSQSEGRTDIYMTFEYVRLGVVNSGSFTGGGFLFEGYAGEIGGEQIEGVRAVSSAYQPSFTFTDSAVSAIKAYAEKNGFDTLTIHTYALLTNNGFVVNGKWTAPGTWNATQVPIADLTSAFTFWSQSEGTTEVYLWCEFGKAPAVPTVPASSFTGGFAFENFEGEVGGEQIVAVKATSANYQPHFYFTEEGLAALKAYAAANGFDTLTFHAYANVSNNSFVLNNQKWVVAEWATLEVKIADLTTAFDFWSASEGTTEVYLWCEFGKAPVQPLLSASFFTGSLTFEDFTGTVGGETFTGIKATGASYQPHFYFTEDAISAIKAFAAENHYDTLTIHAYANLTNNCLVLNNQCWVVAEWNKLTVSIADLTTAFDFWSQSEGTTELYLRFEYGQSAVQSLSAANAMLGGTLLMEL